MKNRKFTLVTAILLLLLFAAIANMIVVSHFYNRSLEARTTPAAGENSSSFNGGQALDSSPGVTPVRRGTYFDWIGDLALVKATAGGYDAVVTVKIRRPEAPVSADSVEMDIRRGSAGAAEITPELKETEAGKYVAHIDFPEAGEWEIRMRIHRGLQTIEFARKFTIQ